MVHLLSAYEYILSNLHYHVPPVLIEILICLGRSFLSLGIDLLKDHLCL